MAVCPQEVMAPGSAMRQGEQEVSFGRLGERTVRKVRDV